MAQTVLPNQLTVATPEQAAVALADAYARGIGSRPSKKILSLLMGQAAGETGNFKSMHNFNFGNVKASSSYPLVTYFRCSEIVNGQEVFYDPPAAECRFRAFRTLEDGAAAYIETLKKNPHWWQGLQTGTVDGFIAGLTFRDNKSGFYPYFTANVEKYRTLLADRTKKYLPLAEKYGASLFALWAAFYVSALIGAGVVAWKVGSK